MYEMYETVLCRDWSTTALNNGRIERNKNKIKKNQKIWKYTRFFLKKFKFQLSLEVA